MKIVNLILSLVIFFAICSTAYSIGGVDPPYRICNWQGSRQGAITYTFDDNCDNQFSIVIPMFDEFDYKLTMYPVINWMTSAKWTALQNAAANGHEIGSHTVTHTNLSGLTIPDQTTELVDSQNTINSYIPGNQCLTIAYPYCSPSDTTLTRTYYISGRVCDGQIEPNKPDSWFSVSSIICGDQGGINSESDFISKFTSTASSFGWCVFLIHGIDDDGGYSPLDSNELRASLEYLDENRDTYWVATFRNVTQYSKERRNTSVSESSSTDNSITLQVTDTLDDTLYDCPLTIRRPLPAGWSAANVTQNGQPVPSSIVEVGSTSYVIFDVVPDGGDVILSKVFDPPEGLRATPDSNSVSLDWNDSHESSLAGYNVYRSTTYSDGYSKINASLLSSSDYNDVNIPLDTTYYYVVTAEDVNSFETGYSNQVVVFGDLYGDFINNDVIDMNDLDIFLDYWPVNDCNETAGVDIDDNCAVNFPEFADLAINWLQEP